MRCSTTGVIEVKIQLAMGLRLLAGEFYLDVAARFGVTNNTVFPSPPPSPFVLSCSLGLIKGRRYLDSYDREPPRTAALMLPRSLGCD